MPTFEIDASDGHTYEVDAPDEATARAEFTRQYKPMGNAEQAVEMVKHPGRSINDLLRTASNFVTFGARDRIAPYLGSGRTYEQERQQTAAADARLGTWDDAAKLGMAALQPSAVESYLPRGAGYLKSMLGYGTEGALQGATQAAIQGDSTVKGAVKGFVGGAGGATVGNVMDRGLRFPVQGTAKVLDTFGNIAKGGENPLTQGAMALATHGYGPVVGRTSQAAAGYLSSIPTRAFQTQGSSARDAFAKMLIGMGRS